MHEEPGQAGRPGRGYAAAGRRLVAALLEAGPRGQRWREHALARGGADERDRLDVHRDRLCLGPLEKPDVDLVVLRRRVAELLDDRTQPMDLVDEQDVAG